ncbi:sugar MFS transporter [Niabella aurantiaca]|uniref:sugar MFS transporter n=1 Tax=Niabella aurantiaca TaxID=379900 RepID=UPI00037717EC|nr:sugar MFS transporter [Niabella aurantiaca]
MNDQDYRDRKKAVTPLVIVGALFLIIGAVSWVNAILIPYFKIACELTHFESYFVALVFYISYFFISLPAGLLLNRIGFKKGIMVALWIMALGAFVFIPAAQTRTYGVFLCGLFLIGTGLSVLQTAVNPYVTILGPIERAAQRISIMGVCNKFAGIIAPLVFAAVVLKPEDAQLFQQLPGMMEVQKNAALDELIRRVIGPYAVVGAGLFLLGLLVRYSPLPEINTAQESAAVRAANSGKRSILQFPHLILGAIAIFVHVGAQILSIDTIISYAGSMGIDLVAAKRFPSYTLFATMIGYGIGILCIPKIFSQKTALKCCTLLGFVLSLLVVFTGGRVQLLGYTADSSIWFLAALGFANSLIWAGIWPLAIEGLGRFTKVGAAVLIMGLVGNALMPVLYGYFAETIGLKAAYWILIPCFIYLIFYAFYGHKIRRWHYAKAPKDYKR